ncbi:hypothetical protein NLG42_14255 [Flavobacterium plurextorum]|uniref:hypothetical protein n=1 Tax=Flavobacterium TaxID=237 RepID=UPI00214D5B1F|nr:MULTISPECIES: hypothetical protein [Flavobacterium]UUW07267.1 hypothetical protein NLG42_14255 [Flavobacterium plurextorum]
MGKILPTIEIEGTTFIIDVVKEELVEKANPHNIMAIKNMFYAGHTYQFDYDINTRNLAGIESAFDFKENVTIKKITIPNLTQLDPLRMAQRYNTTVENIKGKTDFELTISPGSLLDLRWNQRILPILKIAGHPFFVDIAGNKLRPKDDFKSKGIGLDQINDYYDRIAHAYIIPYNPKTHEFQEIDHLAITKLPEEIIVVQFPHLQELDRVGWNVKYGFPPSYCIRENEFLMDFKSRTLPWAETNIPNSIKRNLEEKRNQKNIAPASEKTTELPSNNKKGRKI